MSTLSDEIGYGAIIEQYLDAYNRKAEILASPMSEVGFMDAIEAELTGEIPVEQINDFDKASNAIIEYSDSEVVRLNQILEELKVSILEFFDLYPAVTKIYSRSRLQGIVPVDPTTIGVVVWP